MLSVHLKNGSTLHEWTFGCVSVADHSLNPKSNLPERHGGGGNEKCIRLLTDIECPLIFLLSRPRYGLSILLKRKSIPFKTPIKVMKTLPLLSREHTPKSDGGACCLGPSSPLLIIFLSSHNSPKHTLTHRHFHRFTLAPENSEHQARDEEKDEGPVFQEWKYHCKRRRRRSDGH